VVVERIEDGLWRWAAAHPEWRPGDNWDRDVGSVYWEARDAVALFDPVVPQERHERDRFFAALDRDVRRLDVPVVILLTCAWHRRSADELAERYEASIRGALDEVPLPGDAVAVRARAAREAVYWLPSVRSVVTGDALLGADGGVSLCPDAWLEWRGGTAQLVTDLQPLLELPVERVLTSHGPPVLAGGRAAVARALARG
jgi:hypothetical protein